MNQAKIYVGNLSYQTSSDELNDVFSAYGNIEELKLIIDHQTGRSKGFAFITFETEKAAEAALELNSTTIDGRQIKVNPAKDNRTGGGAGGAGGARRRDDSRRG